MENIRTILLEMLSLKKHENPGYSLRSFAISSGVSPATMSGVLQGKRPITAKTLDKIVYGPHMPPSYRRRIEQVRKQEKLPKRKRLEADQFSLIADWYHYAILCLPLLETHSSRSVWVAKKLGISTLEAKAALKRLQELGYLKVSGEKLIDTTEQLETSFDIPSEAIKLHHRQQLGRAEKALEEISVEFREFGSMTMPANLENLEKAKIEIRKFRKKIEKILEAGEKTEVYTLNVQLFPTGNPDKKGND